MIGRSAAVVFVLALVPASLLAKEESKPSILDIFAMDVERGKVTSATVYYLPYGTLRAFGLNAAMLRVAPEQVCQVQMTANERQSLSSALRNSKVTFAQTEGHDMHWGADFKDGAGNIRYSLFIGEQFPGHDFVESNYDGSFVNLGVPIARWFEQRQPHWACSRLSP